MKHTEKKKALKNKQRIRELWENFKQLIICIIGVPEVEGYKKIEKNICRNNG